MPGAASGSSDDDGNYNNKPLHATEEAAREVPGGDIIKEDDMSLSQEAQSHQGSANEQQETAEAVVRKTAALASNITDPTVYAKDKRDTRHGLHHTLDFFSRGKQQKAKGEAGAILVPGAFHSSTEQPGTEGKREEDFNVMTIVEERANLHLGHVDVATEQDDNQQHCHEKAGIPTVNASGLRPGAYSGAPGVASCRRNTMHAQLGSTPPQMTEQLSSHDLSSSSVISRSGNTGGVDPVDAMEDGSGDVSPFAASPSQGCHSQSSSSKLGLAEATPVSEALLVGEAQAVDSQEMGKQQLKKQQRQQCKRFGCLLIGVSLLIMGIALGVVLGKKENDPTFAPSTMPSLAPTEAPSSAPTGALDMLLMDLPNSTTQQLKNVSTPQWKAYYWLLNHPDLHDMEEWRKTQLFALATFFHAMEGPHWRKEIQQRWMTYDQDECYWFSGKFGWFYGDDGSYMQDQFRLNDAEPCNGNNVFEVLHLAYLELSGYHPYIPPEIALLTSLRSLQLPSNGINASLEDMLPSEVIQMPHLKLLDLNTNALSGTLPSEVGRMAHLEKLVLYFNQLSGTIPTQVGVPTNMQSLMLPGNAFTGSLPTELGQLAEIKTLMLSTNAYTGQLPSQVGQLSLLSHLSAFQASFTGTIPSWLGLLGNLDEIHLDENFFSGQLPSQLGQLTNTTIAFLDSNQFSGTLPSQLGGMSRIQVLDLSTNNLVGTLPTELGQLSELVTIFLSNNSLTGEIPLEVSRLSVNATGYLEGIFLRHNYLSGIVPEEICGLGECNITAPWCFVGVSFDCNDQLCGCDWCECGFVGMNITALAATEAGKKKF